MRNGGSSPRVRGTLQSECIDELVKRFIPARAGNMTIQHHSSQTATVHPRACGEHSFPGPRRAAESGSSPRVRGTSSSCWLCSDEARFIPARAGNIAKRVHRRTGQAVHPRACGEHSFPGPRRAAESGSSPRVRGTSSSCWLCSDEARFIPARAGNMTWHDCIWRRATVHPRACGEHRRSNCAARRLHGSSPRVRGTLLRRSGRSCSLRFIPARAGNILSKLISHSGCPVHPRACGEHLDILNVRSGDNGSSPRVRGTYSGIELDSLMIRFIPARAGNIQLCVDCVIQKPVHPRACGEHILRRDAVPRCDGSSPRVRGTYSATRCRSAIATVHPRACGEHGPLQRLWRAAHGSSPRVRGTYANCNARHTGQRFIPARAGNICVLGQFYDRCLGSSPRVRGTYRSDNAAPSSRRFIPARAGNIPSQRIYSAPHAVHPRACGEHSIANSITRN